MREGSASAADGINVDVVVLGGEVKPLLMANDCTVEDCLTAAGFDTSSTVKVGGTEVALGDHPENGDRLVVTNKVKGGRA